MTKSISLFALALAISVASCQNSQKPVQEENVAPATEQTAQTADSVYSPEKIMAEGATLIDKTVVVEGTVTLVCKHAGRKCSIMGNDPEAFIQVMAAGDIESFPSDLIGSNIKVKGLVKENRITMENVVKQEEAIKAAAQKSENKEASEHCSQSMHNVNKMKQWMKDNNKEYYPLYFVTGTSYEVVE